MIAQQPAMEGDRPAVAGWLQRACRTAVLDLPAMGVGISLLPTVSAPVGVAASSEASARVEELQFVLGEGPCIAAHISGMPVLVPDLSATARTAWPTYAPAAHAHDVRAVFAFPLQVGSARLGALDVYCDHTGALSPDALARAATYADLALQRLLDADAGGHLPEGLLDDVDDHRLEVYQAQGMVMAQLQVDAQVALMRLRAHAFAAERRAIDVARDIIARKLVLEPDL